MVLRKAKNIKAQLSDEEIIALYWQKDETAIAETDFKYKNYLLTVAFNILGNPSDCEECLNDTYLGTWNAIPPAKPNAFKAFLTIIIRRLAIKRYHTSRKKSVIPPEMTFSLSELSEFVSGAEDVDSAFDAKRFGKTLSEFVRSLSPRKQYVFISRYYICAPIDTIAKELGVSRSTVNKELAAIRKNLKIKLESEGYSV